MIQAGRELDFEYASYIPNVIQCTFVRLKVLLFVCISSARLGCDYFLYLQPLQYIVLQSMHTSLSN